MIWLLGIGVFVLEILLVQRWQLASVARFLSASSAEEEQLTSKEAIGQYGSWLGNTWIPPEGWKYYSVSDLQSLYGSKRILFLGDSTARRSGMVLYSILNHTATSAKPWERTNSTTTTTTNNSTTNSVDLDNLVSTHSIGKLELEQLIDINRRNKTHPCTAYAGDFSVCLPFPRDDSVTQAGGELVVHFSPCLKDISSFFQKYYESFHQQNSTTRIVPDFDLIVVALGIWHEARPNDCKDPLSIRQQIENIVQLQKQFVLSPDNNGPSIIWRTSGWFGRWEGEQDAIQEYNQAIRDTIRNPLYAQNSGVKEGIRKQSLSYFDWGRAIRSRSFGTERIHGDLLAHYGLEARLAAIMMLTNMLEEQGWWGEQETQV